MCLTIIHQNALDITQYHTLFYFVCDRVLSPSPQDSLNRSKLCTVHPGGEGMVAGAFVLLLVRVCDLELCNLPALGS